MAANTSTMTAIDFATAKIVFPAFIKAKLPILIRGRHGIGKSELVYSFAPHIAKIVGMKDPTYAYPVVERRASQMADAGDIMGLPKMQGDVTEFSPMAWFHKACVEPCILFLDEIDRGNQDVRQAIFELTDSRKIAGHKLHPDTIIFAAINGGSDQATYQVGEMDPAELSRWSVFDVKPTEKDWLDYTKPFIAPQVWDFINQHPGHLEHKGEFEPNKVYPCRRSWVRLHNVFAGTDLLTQPLDSNGKLRMEMFYLSQALIGQETAIAFQDFVKNYKFQITIEDIINGGQIAHVKKLDNNSQLALIDKFDNSPLSKLVLSKNQLENLGKFILACEAELAMKLWEVTTANNGPNGIALHGLIIDNRSVSDYLAELNGAEK